MCKIVSIFRDKFWTLKNYQTKWLVGLGVIQKQTVIGFLMKWKRPKHASYSEAVLKLMMYKILNIFLVIRIVITLTVWYTYLIFDSIWVLTHTFTYFKNTILIAKLLVTTGSLANSYQNGLHSEIVDLDNNYADCGELANSAYPIEGATGGLVGGKPMICGGFYENLFNGASKECFVLGQNQTITMKHERSYPAGISISKDKVSHFTLQLEFMSCIAMSPCAYLFLALDHRRFYFKVLNWNCKWNRSNNWPSAGLWDVLAL